MRALTHILLVDLKVLDGICGQPRPPPQQTVNLNHAQPDCEVINGCFGGTPFTPHSVGKADRPPKCNTDCSGNHLVGREENKSL